MEVDRQAILHTNNMSEVDIPLNSYDPMLEGTLKEKHSFDQQQWDTVIQVDYPLFHIPWKEIWGYRELVFRMVQRDFVAQFKQTLLGSLWYVLQPLLNSLMFTLVFVKIAKIPVGEVPPIIFFLAGTVCWGYFSGCVNGTATTFTTNKDLFDKVYFPRLIVPIAQAITNMIGFVMQMGLFLVFLIIFIFLKSPIHPTWAVLEVPFLLLEMAILGIGVGCFVAAVTTRFRDLQLLLGFFLQLWMYGSCVVYPLKLVPHGFLRIIYLLNPMVAIIESFRYAFIGQSTVGILDLTVGFVLVFVTAFVGIILFNKTERLCVDIL